MQEIKKIENEKKPKINLKYMRDKDRELVKGIFRFHEVPGGSMPFVYRAYKEDEFERYDLVDGQIYTLPLGVARHLNKNCWYPEYGYVTGEAGEMKSGYGGNSGMRVTHKVRRCSFQSLEFMDSEDLTPNSLSSVTPNGVAITQ